MSGPKPAAKAWRAMLAGLICGAAVWALSVPLAGAREAFDAPGYYLPAMLVAGIVAAWPAPRYWWLAVIGIFLGERLYAYAMLPETRDWLLFGLLINLLLPTWLPAALGALGVYIVAWWRGKRAN
jgi:hypothetical protein